MQKLSLNYITPSATCHSIPINRMTEITGYRAHCNAVSWWQADVSNQRSWDMRHCAPSETYWNAIEMFVPQPGGATVRAISTRTIIYESLKKKLKCKNRKLRNLINLPHSTGNVENFAHFSCFLAVFPALIVFVFPCLKWICTILTRGGARKMQ